MSFIVFFIYAQVFNITENRCKNYIIKHKNEIVSYKYNYFEIKKCNLNYYTNITLKFYPKDSLYYLIFWGNRNSLLWNTRLDKNFLIDIRYNRYKNKNVKRDIEIYNLYKELKDSTKKYVVDREIYIHLHNKIITTNFGGV
jgi:hypothetical protein